MSEPVLPERVVFVCATYLPRVTGVATAINAWARQLIPLGVRVTVVAPEYPPYTFYPLHVYPDDLDVVRLPARPAPFVLGIQTARAHGVAWDDLLTSLRHQNAVVHGQDVLLAGEIAAKIGRRCHLPVMLHAHYPLGDGDLADWLTFSTGTVGRRAINAVLDRTAAQKARSVCRQAGLVAAVSPYIQGILAERGINDARVLPCGVDPPSELPAIDIRKRHGIPEDSPIFLYVGRMDPDKHIGDLLEAAAVIRQREPRARLLLVGGGPYLDRYVSRAEALRLGDTAVFAGWVPYRDIWAYYAQADLFVFANPHEAQGLVTIEAQAMGLPVVGYRGGGVSLAVVDGETGILTDHNPMALAGAALALHGDAARRQAMASATRTQAARYTSEQVFPALLDTYTQLANGVP